MYEFCISSHNLSQSKVFNTHVLLLKSILFLSLFSEADIVTRVDKSSVIFLSVFTEA